MAYNPMTGTETGLPYTDQLLSGLNSLYTFGKPSVPSTPVASTATGFGGVGTDAAVLSPDKTASLTSNLGAWWDANKAGIMGTKDNPGYLSTGLGTATNLANLFMSLGNYGRGVDAYEAAKSRGNADYSNKVNSYNDSLNRLQTNRESFRGASTADAASRAAAHLKTYGATYG